MGGPGLPFLPRFGRRHSSSRCSEQIRQAVRLGRLLAGVTRLGD
jgi:hypothetical protein